MTISDASTSCFRHASIPRCRTPCTSRTKKGEFELTVVLHISDLHRTREPRIENESLLAAIDNDSRRWRLDGIAHPDLLVVSGDLVQGVPIDCNDFENELASQYEEAYGLLTGLTERLFGGDRSRVVVVPGNHDVCWPAARVAMRPMTSVPPNLQEQVDHPSSGIRWDWAHQQAFEIADSVAYERRLDHFREFRSRFYAPVDPEPLAHDPDLLHMEFAEHGIVMVGFSSWLGNDCFCMVGDVEPRLLAKAQRILTDSRMPIAVAVWHHSIAGGPRARDYMDDQVVHKMVDAGFVLGLHGHQHRADAATYEIRLPNMSSLCVISAGSLCVGDLEIPTGENRQFNLVEIRQAKSNVRVHFRQMTASGLFNRSPRMEFGGNSYKDMELPTSLSRPAVPSRIVLLDRAIEAIRAENYAQALVLLGQVESAGHDNALRALRIEALGGLEEWDAILEMVGDTPRSGDELVLVVKILMDRGELDRAERVTSSSTAADRALVEDLRERIEVRRAMK